MECGDDRIEVMPGMIVVQCICALSPTSIVIIALIEKEGLVLRGFVALLCALAFGMPVALAMKNGRNSLIVS